MLSRLLFVLIALSLGVLNVNGQDLNPGGVAKKKCYERYDKKGNLIPPSEYRYSEWQCGKVAGTIDCHNELSFDEGSNTIIRISQDNTNLMGVGKPYTGRCESCHMNGVREHSMNFVNGKEEGVDTTWYPSGCIQVIRSFTLGKEHGTWTYFYDSTYQEAWVMNYYNGQKDGVHVYLTKDGDTTKLETYGDNVYNGEVRTYYTNLDTAVVLKSIANYKDGILDGKFTVFNPWGVVIQELEFKNGEKNKECKYFYDDGTLLRIENWTMGVKNGSFKSLYKEQQTYLEEIYVKGRKEGTWAQYYSTGIMSHKWVYKKDSLMERYEYDEHGRQTFPKPNSSESEDDAAPGKKKKKKKKKDKKPKANDAKKEENVEFD